MCCVRLSLCKYISTQLSRITASEQVQIITKHQRLLVVLSIALGTCVLVGSFAKAEPQVAACEPKFNTAFSQAENIDSTNQSKAVRLNQLSEQLIQFRLGNELPEHSSSVQVRGSAKRLERNKQGKYLLKQASATKCPDGNNDVVIEASEMEIDPEAGEGKAKKCNASLQEYSDILFSGSVLSD